MVFATKGTKTDIATKNTQHKEPGHRPVKPRGRLRRPVERLFVSFVAFVAETFVCFVAKP